MRSISLDTPPPRSEVGPDWLYGVDPRPYGLSRQDYEAVVRRHRLASVQEHAAVYGGAARQFFQWSGFVFWCVVWFWLFFVAMPTLGKVTRELSAQKCLADIAKCEAVAGKVAKQ